MADVTFNGTTKIIAVNNGITSLSASDLYAWWKEWVLDDNANFPPAMQAIGGDPIGDGLFTGTTFFVLNGWLIRPYAGNHTLTISGNLFGEDGAEIITPVLGSYTVGIQFRNTAQAQGISTSSSPAGLTTAQEAKLLEIYALMGLDPSKPLIVSPAARTAGDDINQSISKTGDTVTVTRA